MLKEQETRLTFHEHDDDDDFSFLSATLPPRMDKMGDGELRSDVIGMQGMY
jgi:hypothetical protein